MSNVAADESCLGRPQASFLQPSSGRLWQRCDWFFAWQCHAPASTDSVLAEYMIGLKFKSDLELPLDDVLEDLQSGMPAVWIGLLAQGSTHERSNT